MKRTLYCAWVLLFALSACNALPTLGVSSETEAAPPSTAPAETPTAVVSAAPVEPSAAPPTAPAAAPTDAAAVQPTAAPVVPAPAGVLPAPLLFIAYQEDTNQIWRLESDGVTQRALTAETMPVYDFDVSPLDGRLAYITNNDLVIANADGSNRTLLVDGPEPPAENDPLAALQQLGKPRWSPDGTRIAYSLGGVNMVPAAGGAPQLLLKSDPPPALPPAPAPGSQGGEPPVAMPTVTPTYAYWPEAWSPDGSRLLLGYALFPESGGLALLDPAGGQPLLIKSPEPIACCHPAWSPDSASIYYASPYFGMFMAGLWRAGVADGSAVTLIQGDDKDGTFHLPGFVHAAGEALFFFYAQADTFPEGQTKLTAVSAPAANPTAPTPLRSDAWLLGEALWAPDASGVVILNLEASVPGATGEAAMLGQLFYLKSDNSPAVPLPATGRFLHWGK